MSCQKYLSLYFVSKNKPRKSGKETVKMYMYCQKKENVNVMVMVNLIVLDLSLCFCMKGHWKPEEKQFINLVFLACLQI